MQVFGFRERYRSSLHLSQPVLKLSAQLVLKRAITVHRSQNGLSCESGLNVCMPPYSQTFHFENYESVGFANMAIAIHVHKSKSLNDRHKSLGYLHVCFNILESTDHTYRAKFRICNFCVQIFSDTSQPSENLRN